MLLTSLRVDRDELEQGTGWKIQPVGACKGPLCVPLPDGAMDTDGRIDVATVAERLGMALVADSEHDLWALGPESAVTGRALTTAVAPDLELPTIDGKPFRLSDLRGSKVVLVSWASW